MDRYKRWMDGYIDIRDRWIDIRLSDAEMDGWMDGWKDGVIN